MCYSPDSFDLFEKKNDSLSVGGCTVAGLCQLLLANLHVGLRQNAEPSLVEGNLLGVHPRVVQQHGSDVPTHLHDLDAGGVDAQIEHPTAIVLVLRKGKMPLRIHKTKRI